MNAVTHPAATGRGAAPLDVAAVRRDFPILARTVNGQPLAYLDNAASSQRPQAVIDAISRYYETTHANVHRGVHALSQEATDLFEGARRQGPALHQRALHARRSSSCAARPRRSTWSRRAAGGRSLQPG